MHPPLVPNASSRTALGNTCWVNCLPDAVRATIPVGEECVINLDPSEAGQGRITCRIGSNVESDVDIDIVDNGDGTVSIMYTPRKPGAYTLEIKFGGKPIPNGTFTQQALNPEDYKQFVEDNPDNDLIVPQRDHGVRSAPPKSAEKGGPGNPLEFTLPVGPDFDLVTAEVTTPSGRKQKPKLIDNKDGTVKVVYTPAEVGLHYLDVAYDGVPISGSPFQFFVDEARPGHVTAFGPGLRHGVVGTNCDFTIVTKDAGNGGLGLAVEGPSKADLTCADNGDGTCSASYVPTEPGVYKVNVKFDDKHIAGSPFTAKVTPADDKRSLPVGAVRDVPLLIDETMDLDTLVATVVSPSGTEQPATLKRLDNGVIGVSFAPHEAGEHLISVKKDGKHIPHSPFTTVVDESELGHPNRVKAYGKGLSEGTANEVNSFTVDTREAGYGGLSISVEGKSKAEIECCQNPDGTCKVNYTPTEPGAYVINVKFADEHIPGSPFMATIGGEGQMTEKISRRSAAAPIAQVGSECELALKIPNTSLAEMEATVTSPSGVTERCSIEDLGKGQYSIKFVPKELGVHTVSVKHLGVHIPGSPFQFTVGPITDTGAHKVRAIGPGLEKGVVNVPGHFNILTHEAGAGALSIAMEGPSKADIDFQDHNDGSCEVAYTCTQPGEYLVIIKWNDQQIPDSPFKVYIAPSGADSTTLSTHDLPNKVLEINKPASFAVDVGKVHGPLDARVVAPSGAEYAAVIQEIEKGHCAVSFVPRENGLHHVHVRENNVPVHGSPFAVRVGKLDADAARVRAYGDGLSKGQTGQPAKFVVNTTNAGSGALAVTVDGPSKVQLNCREVADGYEFSYTPTAPGEYLIIIKYAGSHIPGSAFKANVTGSGRAGGPHEQSQVIVETITKSSTTQSYLAPHLLHDSDATKVVSKGVGLQKATIGKDATFSVDTSQAGGHSMLLVGVMGPRVPCEEVSVRHLGGGQYTVIYRPSETGDHILIIKWGDQHIAGSPFHIVVQ